MFWIIPMVRRWGIPWYAVGIGGTAVFMAIFFITRIPDNPITGRGDGMNTMSIMVEVFQAAFIVLAAGIVVALVLIGLLLLPMTMSDPMGGPLHVQREIFPQNSSVDQ